MPIHFSLQTWTKRMNSVCTQWTMHQSCLETPVWLIVIQLWSQGRKSHYLGVFKSASVQVSIVKSELENLYRVEVGLSNSDVLSACSWAPEYIVNKANSVEETLKYSSLPIQSICQLRLDIDQEWPSAQLEVYLRLEHSKFVSNLIKAMPSMKGKKASAWKWFA